MSNPISSFPLRIHANTNPSYFEQIKNCFDAITQFVLKIFRQIGDFFYNLFHTQPNNQPELQIPARVINNPELPVVQDLPIPLPDPQNTIAIQKEEVKPVAADKNEQLEPIILNPVIYHAPWVDPQKMISFYRGETPSDRGTTLQYILSLDDTKLDYDDHWIWAFPTNTLNSDIPTGPLLSGEDLKTILKDPIVRENILKVFKRMLAYFGLQLNDENQIEKAPNFDERAKSWITYNNYNYRRIGRIIHSLGNMNLYGGLPPGPEGYDRKLVNCLEKIFHDNKAQMGYEIFQGWWVMAFH